MSDPTLNKSGVYWSWDNDKSSLWFDSVDGALENRVSEEVGVCCSCRRHLRPAHLNVAQRAISASLFFQAAPAARTTMLCEGYLQTNLHVWLSGQQPPGVLPPACMQVSNDKKGAKLWDISMKLVGLE